MYFIQEEEVNVPEANDSGIDQSAVSHHLLITS